MCRSETLTMVVSSTSINVANITAAAISHGLKLGAHGAVCGAICSSVEAGAATSAFRSVFFVSEFIVASFLGTLISKPASLRLLDGLLDFHFRFDRHARPQWEVLIRRFGENDLDRHALNDFHVIASRIFRRQ